MYSIKELNEHTDLQISIKEIKKGRGVDRIEFTINHSVEKEIKLPIAIEKTKQNVEHEEIRERLNVITQGFIFDQAFFAQLYQGASLIWNDDAEKELQMLIRYVNQEETVKNPLGFIKSKIKIAWDVHQDGLTITFADLKVSKRPTGRQEVIPEWFHDRKKSREETGATVLSEEDQDKKRILLGKLGLSPEEIEEKIKDNK